MALISPPNPRRQIATMLSGSFVSTVAFYAYFLHSRVNTTIEKPSLEIALRSPLLIPFAIVSVSMLCASFFITRLLGPKAISAAEQMRGVDPGEAKARQQKAFTSFIISMALADATGVFGFVIGIGANNFEIAMPFFVASVFAMAVHWKTFSSQISQ